MTLLHHHHGDRMAGNSGGRGHITVDKVKGNNKCLWVLNNIFARIHGIVGSYLVEPGGSR